MAKKDVVEKLLLKKRVHFGSVKETFSAGAVLEVNVTKGVFRCDGRDFTCLKDVEALKRIGMVVPYSVEASQEVKADNERLSFIRKQVDGDIESEHMKIVKSDADLMNKDIDIAWTKTPKKVATPLVKGGKMPVIKGDEGLAERQARVNALSSSIPKMPVVSGDETLGASSAGSASRNAGQVTARPNPRAVAAAVKPNRARKVAVAE